MDPVETADFYELVVERHRKTSTVITSNRDPSEWLGAMSDPLLAQPPSTGSSPPATSSSSRASLAAANNDHDPPATACPD